MTSTKGIHFEGRFFWANQVAAGVFLKYLVEEAEASEHADEPWLSEAVSRWRVQAGIVEFSLTLEEQWSSAQREIFIMLADGVCKRLASRESIPGEEVASWRSVDNLRIGDFVPGVEICTAPIIELGHAIIALVWKPAATTEGRSPGLWISSWPFDDPNERRPRRLLREGESIALISVDEVPAESTSTRKSLSTTDLAYFLRSQSAAIVGS